MIFQPLSQCSSCYKWPHVPMVKASPYGAGDCRFESYCCQVSAAELSTASVLASSRTTPQNGSGAKRIH
eukprot:4153646-Amphidinium_carterae.1